MASMARETTAPVSTWRDAVLGDGLTSVGTSGIQPPAAPGSFVRAPSPKPSSRCSTSMVLAHSVDLIVLALFAAVAALLRFGDFYLIRPQLRGLGGLCNVEDYFLPLRESTVDLPPYSIYILVILAPIVLAVLLEFALAFALRRQILRAQAAAGSWKTFFYKRAAKTLLVLLLGLCLTSTITDVLRLLVSRPRPYFLSQGQAWGRYCNTYEDATISSEERDARLSFPSHRCSMLAYAGGVMALHAELVLRRLQAGGIYVLRVVVLLVATMPALLVASQCLESRSNHWQDVVVGLLLGTLLAVYVELVLGSEMVHEARVVASTPLSDTGRRGQFLPRLRTPRGPSTAPSVEDINNVQPHLRPPHIFKGEDAFF